MGGWVGGGGYRFKRVSRVWGAVSPSSICIANSSGSPATALIVTGARLLFFFF